MVNTRAKFKKTQNTLKLCFTQASMVDSDHLSTQSGALIGSNDDLITEFLRRLPVTSVLRFKSVSKHWRSLLSHRRFTLLFNDDSISPGFFVRNLYIPFDEENQSPPPFRDLDFYPDLCGLRIIQSCNGLLLCCSDRGLQRARKYYVFNPTTKQFAIIPLVPGGKDVRKNIRFMALAFHQTDCVHFKVVCIHPTKPNPDEEVFQIQIYSSETRKWKISDQTFSAPYHRSFSSGVYWNGAIHWTPTCHTPPYFNLKEEQFQTLPLPSPLPASVASFGGYCRGVKPRYFGESQGYLHLVDIAHRDRPLHLNVYEMVSYRSGWFLKYEVELNELPYVYPDLTHGYQHPSDHRYYQFDVVDVVRGEKEEDTFMVIILPHKVIKYNLSDKSFKQISVLKHRRYDRIKHSEVHRYIVTLASF